MNELQELIDAAYFQAENMGTSFNHLMQLVHAIEVAIIHGTPEQIANSAIKAEKQAMVLGESVADLANAVEKIREVSQ